MNANNNMQNCFRIPQMPIVNVTVHVLATQIDCKELMFMRSKIILPQILKFRFLVQLHNFFIKLKKYLIFQTWLTLIMSNMVYQDRYGAVI